MTTLAVGALMVLVLAAPQGASGGDGARPAARGRVTPRAAPPGRLGRDLGSDLAALGCLVTLRLRETGRALATDR